MSQDNHPFLGNSWDRTPCSEADLDLWRREVSNVLPLSRYSRSRWPSSVSLPPLSTPRLLNQDRKQAGCYPLQKGSSQLVETPPYLLDRHQMRYIVCGKRKIDSRLDLHGLALAAAHETLISYIVGMRACGKQILLVITGKGRSDRTGRIKAELPRWLMLQPLGDMVRAHGPACPRHGGEGARYLVLRALRR